MISDLDRALSRRRTERQLRSSIAKLDHERSRARELKAARLRFIAANEG